MNRTTFCHSLTSLIMLLCLLSLQAQAALTNVRASSNKNLLIASSPNSVTINWQVAATANHTQGLDSTAQAEVFDPAGNTLLLSLGGSFSRAGSGPFTLSETLNFNGRQIQTWLADGIQRIVVRRSFQEQASTGASIFGEIAFSLANSPLGMSRSGAGELTIQSLKLALSKAATTNATTTKATADSVNAIQIIEQHGVLQPTLDVFYAGTGLLAGRWQIAEPDSTQGKPLFRTLSIVHQALVKSQHTLIQGPLLPSNRAGRYLLRFCVTNQTADDQAPEDAACPNPALSVQAVYQVMPNDTPVSILDIHSPRQQQVNNQSEFSWSATPRAAIYKLEVLEKVTNQPQLVTGMLLPARHTRTQLSELMQSKLQDGASYAWQISAIDADGRVLAKSKLFQFSYQP